MTDVDVIVVGAGPAGLAAAMSLDHAGLSIAHVEARDRVGGRTWSLDIGRAKGVDVGAHWLHARTVNPLAKEARRLGIGLHSADKWPIVIDGDEILGTWGQAKLWRAWKKIDKGIVRLADCQPGAAAHLAVDTSDRWQRIAGELHGTHACGIPLSEVSVEDFANANDSEDRFVDGGYGTLVARAGAAATPRLGVRVTAVSLTEDGVEAETTAGRISARSILLTLPATLIANGSITFTPGLPEAHRAAACDLPFGSYERLVFTLGDDPFAEERDRAVILIDDEDHSCYMLAGGGGQGIHFADFGGNEARELASKGMDAMADVVQDWLDWHVGSSVARSLKPLHASNWTHDPLSLGSWSVARPGRSNARSVLRQPIENRIWFAGEATSIDQWGTVGGAWLEGLRAADEIRRVLRGGIIHSAMRRISALSRSVRRPRNLT